MPLRFGEQSTFKIAQFFRRYPPLTIRIVEIGVEKLSLLRGSSNSRLIAGERSKDQFGINLTPPCHDWRKANGSAPPSLRRNLREAGTFP